ncbi:alpha-L-fucosidase [Streptococcus sp. O1]|uniref:alpha-L-fucosidase n=1 Tax=Streptococcus sp. O1 TaxID=2928735 RepID=UPI00211AFFF4|nr:alpha-L-fucosidase [Streptococcus sp. O1]
MIVTAKHHDGFAIWRSRFTDYEIGHTDYQNGQGDVLADISAAATKYGLAMGLYLSPWDIHEKSYGYYDQDGNPLVGEDGIPLLGRTWEEVEQLDAADYNTFYLHQLEEILSNPCYGCNGRFTEIWLDGAKGTGAAAQRYKLDQWIATIQRYQGRQAGYDTDALLFGAGPYTTVRWIGNESGFAHETTWAPARLVYDDSGIAMDIDTNMHDHYSQGYPTGDVWTVPEADARITSGWFWGPNKKRPKPLSELTEIYLRSVGHGATLLLNIPLNDQGKVDQDILDRIREFGCVLQTTFTTNLAHGAKLDTDSSYKQGLENLLDEHPWTHWSPGESETEAVLTLDFGKQTSFDIVSIEEAIQEGQKICQYQVDISLNQKDWYLMEKGTTIGAKRLIAQHGTQARFVKIWVKAAGEAPLLNRIGVYRAAPDFQVNTTSSSRITKLPLMLGEICSGQMRQLKVQGSHVRIMGESGLSKGTLDLVMDNQALETLDYDAISEGCRTLFDWSLTDTKQHTLAVGLEEKDLPYVYLLVYAAGSYIEFDQSHYSLAAGETVSLVVRRVGASNQYSEVWVENNPGSAVQGDYDTSVAGRYVFEVGESERQILVKTTSQLQERGRVTSR